MKILTTAAIAGLVVGGGYLAFAQQSEHEQHQGATKAQAQKAPTKAMCQQMMEGKQKTMANMKGMDSKLDALVAKMERSSGSNKVNATAAAVKELVAQRKNMHSNMMGMDSKMMGHMMQHMGSGTMADCPMMKGMHSGAG